MRAAARMPKTSPLRGAAWALVPVWLLNAAFPALRLLSQLLCLLAHTARALLRRSAAAAPPALAVGTVAHVCASWRGVPKHPRRAAFVAPLGLLGDRQRSAWIAGFGGHGGLDKAGAPRNAARRGAAACAQGSRAAAPQLRRS